MSPSWLYCGVGLVVVVVGVCNHSQMRTAWFSKYASRQTDRTDRYTHDNNLHHSHRATVVTLLALYFTVLILEEEADRHTDAIQYTAGS